jgi:DNA repair protein RadA/Sms
MLLAAVLEKKAGMSLANHDIFLKVAGGLRLDEPAIDLGILASLASNLLDRAIDPETVVFGEVGLAGEVRAISQPMARISEARKLGFKRCVMPRDNLKGLKKMKEMEIVGVGLITEAVDELFGRQ